MLDQWSLSGGNVWLKLSAVLAGTTSSGGVSAPSGSAPTSGGGRDLSTIGPVQFEYSLAGKWLELLKEIATSTAAD